MKRDMDVIRAIVLAVRNSDGPITRIDDMDQEQLAFHTQLLVEANLLIGKVVTSNLGMVMGPAVLYRLTWEGHDFADSIADEKIWNKAKQHLLGPSIAWSFTILREVITATIKDSLNLK